MKEDNNGWKESWSNEKNLTEMFPRYPKIRRCIIYGNLSCVYVVLEHHFIYTKEVMNGNERPASYTEYADARVHGVYKNKSSAEVKASKLKLKNPGGYICVLQQKIRDWRK